MVDLVLLFVELGKHVSARVLSATNEEGRAKGENPIKLVTDGIKQGNHSRYLEKADITGDSANGEDAIDVDDNDGRLSKSSHASDQASETVVSRHKLPLDFSSCYFVHFGCKTFFRFLVMLENF